MTRPPAVLSTCPDCDARVLVPPTGQRPAPMWHYENCVRLIDQRRCDWCGGPFKPNSPPTAETCQTKCRSARWKFDNGYGTRRPRANGNARSGLQVSFPKAVDVLARFIYVSLPHPRTQDKARRDAELILKGALSDKQRERLEARS